MMQIDKGDMLIAEPFMLDPNFKRAAVLIVDHEDDLGTVGFVLNKKSPYKIEELLDDIGDFEGDVYYGGPVANNILHFLHNVGDMVEDSLGICRGVYWGGDFTAFKFLMAQGLIKPENVRFFLGYSGWSPHQLSEEIKEGSWIIEEMDSNYLFKTDPDNLWKVILQSKGEVYSALSQIDGDYINN
ncbi:MAG: YqgE/AlgH family protein [Saprospiraceae bacterium]